MRQLCQRQRTTANWRLGFSESLASLLEVLASAFGLQAQPC